jgi:hypothetical protein
MMAVRIMQKTLLACGDSRLLFSFSALKELISVFKMQIKFLNLITHIFNLISANRMKE